MKLRLIIATVALIGASNTLAQEDGSQVILPLEAQTCDLPTAPARIPDEATYDQLVAAKADVTSFQQALTAYRECLDGASPEEELTEGNRIALNQAHNYSVEMEERVAESFNTAVRAYRERQAEDG
ncbi:MAG: hypothetical protein AAGH19_12550 [Pseudomonadota bacterium]